MPKYDVSVVGAGLGGLAAAALLSSKKKKTLIVERSESLNSAIGVYEKDGCVFNAAPSLVSGFERRSNLQDIVTRLGILQNISPLLVGFQVALPDRRITVYADQHETIEELRREFPREINALVRFYQDLHKEAMSNSKSRVSLYLSARRSAARFVSKYRFSREVMAFFDVQSLFFFQKNIAKLSLLSLIELLDAPPLHLRGGIKRLADHLHTIILQQGGEIRFNEAFNGLASNKRKVYGIQTSAGIVEAGTVLLTTAPQLQPSTFFIALRDEAVPVGMRDDVLFLPDYTMPHDFIALSLSAQNDTMAAPQGVRALNASFHSSQTIHVGQQECIGRINKLIPFLNDYVVFVEEDKSSRTRILQREALLNKPFRTLTKDSLLSRGENKNVYLLDDHQDAPVQVLSAAQQFVDKMK